MCESPNAAPCPACPSPLPAIELDIPTANAEDRVSTEACEHTEKTAPTTQADGDAEKIAAGIEAQAEAATLRPDTENTTQGASPPSGNSESSPTAPPSVRADVQPPAYTPKERIQMLNWHNWHFPKLNIRYPGELTIIKILFIVNNLLILGTVASCIVLLIWALNEEDWEKKKLRFSLAFAEAGYILFYIRDCWKLAHNYTNYWKHIECRHCIGITQPNATLELTV